MVGKLFEIILEVIGWICIAIAPTLLAAVIGFFVYTTWAKEMGEIFAYAITLIGFFSGAFWATRIWLKHGTINWLSKIYRT